MITRYFTCLIFILINGIVLGQNKNDIKAELDIENNQIKITQIIQYKNTSSDQLKEIYLNDWSHSYATKNTPLAIRFAEEYKTEFHFAKNEDRGYSVITSIKQDGENLSFERLLDQIDVVKVTLGKPLNKNESYSITLQYIVKIPSDKFTRYGRTSIGDFNLKYWYITPAIYNGKWQYYSNKDLDDLFVAPEEIQLSIKYPKNLFLTSELDHINETIDGDFKTSILKGKDRVNSKLYINVQPQFKSTETDYFTFLTDINAKGLPEVDQAIIMDRVAQFLTNNLGNYPHKKLIISNIDSKKNPVYGLNQLPDFIRPFPGGFQYELSMFKIALHNYLENILLINPREEQWLIDGLQIYFLMKYTDMHYPKMKLFGTLADVWGIKSFHAAKLSFNDQYNFLSMHMARSNLDQPLSMQKDSLLKFNKNIANKYKAGVGLRYLDDYINANILEETIKEFIAENKTKLSNTSSFETLLKSKTQKDINWFFEEFISTNKKIDFKIKKVVKTNDSIHVTIKNKRDNKMPVSLFALNNDSIISKTWIDKIETTRTVSIPNNNTNKLVLNYDKIIPEFNLRDNWKSLKGFFFNNKPLQFRLFKDIEDPYYNQVFFMPQLNYNFYDGVSPGLKLYNKTLLPKAFVYDFRPTYGLKSKELVGSGSIYYTNRIENESLYFIRYGLRGKYSNYAPNLSYTSFTPYITFRFRNEKDLRDNYYRYLGLRLLHISRENDPTNEFNNQDDPDYTVFNINYGQSNPNLINFSSWHTDFQLARKFGKIAFTFEYRKLTERNRQYNLRFYAGTFLYNKTYKETDFFSFALDRPTDYLFDYNYLGRSEDTGIYSQQLIIAEGGFKSKLETPFANQWITTLNASTTLWKYIQAYGDIGLVGNHNNDPKIVYDSGIRLNLVTDYFELYFPVYSNLGWEIGQPNYDQRIRFIVTLTPKTLFGLFTRRWY